MEQRALRLGDVVDDYCPRERRVTNHAIVAIVEDVIRQTRCTACDAEHPFKGAREPRLRKKPVGDGVLDDQALADGGGGVPATDTTAPPALSADAAAESAPREEPGRDAGEPGGAGQDDRAADGWLAHRQLIRATLPRTDSEPTPRPIPEFTMHQRQTRGSRGFRHFGNVNVNGNSDANGNGPGRPPGRHGKHRRHRGNKRPR